MAFQAIFKSDLLDNIVKFKHLAEDGEYELLESQLEKWSSIKDVSVRDCYVQVFTSISITDAGTSSELIDDVAHRAAVKILQLHKARELLYEEYAQRAAPAIEVRSGGFSGEAAPIIRERRTCFFIKKRKAAIRRPSGYPQRHRKSSCGKPTNRSDACWVRANWLNVRLGNPTINTVVRAVVKRVFARVRALARDLDYQSGRTLPEPPASVKQTRQDRADARAVREIVQRLMARYKERAQYKQKPKKERLEEVKQARDKRNPAFEEQGGRVLTHVATAAASVICVKLLRVLNKGDAVLSTVQTVIKRFKEAAQGLKNTLGKFLWAVPLVMLIHFVVKREWGFSHPIAGLLVAALGSVLGKSLWGAIAKFFQGGGGDNDNDVELQSGMSASAKLIATVMTFSIFGGKINQRTVTEFTKRISVLDKAAAGWDVFFGWVMQAVESCTNFVRELFGKERVKLVRDSHGPTREWFKRVDAAAERHETGAVDVDADELNRLVELMVEGYRFKDVYRGTDMDRSVNSYLVRASNLLQPHLGAINSRNNFRVEPVVCMLLGDPGIGKTRMAPTLCAAVLMLSGLVPPGTPSTKVASEIWQKGNSEFWNGYSNQLCLVIDDAFQQRADPTDKDNEFMNIIRMVSPWSFPLNFADLASKGRIFFGSKFVFGTTNVTSIQSEACKVIHEPNAVARRITYGYKLVVKPEYTLAGTGRLDDEKYREELAKCAGKPGLAGYPFYMWQVAKHDFMRGETSNFYTSMEELIERMAVDLKRRASGHKDATQMFDGFVGGFTAEPQGVRSLFSEIWKGWCNPPQAASEFSYEIKEPTMLHVTVIERKKYWKRVAGAFARGWDEYWRHSQLARIFLGLALSGAAIVSIGGLKIALKIVQLLLDWITNLLTPPNFRKGGLFRKTTLQSNRPNSVKTKLKGVPRRQKKENKKEEEAVDLQAVNNDACNNVYSNSYKMYTRPEGSLPSVIGQVIFLRDRLAVQPRHFTDTVKDYIADGTLRLTDNIHFRHTMNPAHDFSMSASLYLSLRRLERFKDDIEYLELPMTVRAHRNVVSSFFKEADVKLVGGHLARLDVCEIDDRKDLTVFNSRKPYIVKVAFGRDLPTHRGKVTRYFQYDAPTSAGDCGAPLCIFDNNNWCGHTCLGFHIAGRPHAGIGYSTILTQEDILDAAAHFDIVDDQCAADLAQRGVELQSSHILPFRDNGSFLPLFEVSRPVSISPKSKYYLVESTYGSVGEYDYLPAPLKPVKRGEDWVFPMDNAVKPYSTPLIIYEQPWLEQAVHVAFVPLNRELRDCVRRLYSFDEAVLGVPQEKFRSIPRGTAAGFPYVYDVKGGKKEFFGEEQDYDLTSAKAVELRDRVDYILDRARNNVRLSHVYVDFLKDELRSKAKVEAVATRLISSAPLDYVIAWRMMFGAFSAAVMRHHTKVGMAPGICAYTDWNDLAQKVREKGDKIFDGDFKAFDSSEQPTIHCLILDAINRWYDDGPENARIRRVLWLDLIHSRHIGGRGFDQRHIYQWNKSLPSGHPFTTIVNSLYSLVVLIGAYVVVTGDLTGFWNRVSAVTYGDDNLVNPDDDVAEVYNQVTVADALQREFKLTYTSGRKDGTLEPYTTLDKVTFLKRAFRREDNVWLCPLELDSFLYTHYWCKNKRLESQIINDVLETALEELSMHEDQTWDVYASRLYALLRARGVEPGAPLSRAAYLRIVKSRSDNWF
nr:TPA_asm: non-structural polyprotein [Cosmos bipinnatus dicistro-like virus 1]